MTEAQHADPRRVRLGWRFTVVWFGQAVSAIGSALTGIGVAIWVFLETNSTLWLGTLIALAALPAVVFLPLMGRLDRLPRRPVIIGGDVVAAAAALAVLAAVAADRLEVWHLAIAVFVGAAGTAFQAPAFQAAIPTLVPADAIDRANGLTQLGPAIGLTAAPLLAAPIVSYWGLEAIVLIDIATFAVAITTTVAVRFGTTAERLDTEDDGTWRTAVRWLRTHGRSLAGLLAVMALVNFLLSGFNVALLAGAIELGGASLAGLPLAAGGVAMIVGSVAVGARGIPPQRVRTLAVALVTFGVGCWAGALRPSIWLLSAGVVVSSAAVPAAIASVSTIFHEQVPPAMHGRVFAVRAAVAQSLGPAGALLMGVFIAHVTAPAMAADGWAGRTIGQVIGSGSTRGSALALVAVGLTVGLIALWLAGSSIAQRLDVAQSQLDTADNPTAAMAGPHCVASS